MALAVMRGLDYWMPAFAGMTTHAEKNPRLEASAFFVMKAASGLVEFCALA